MLCAVGDLVEDVVVRLSGPPARGTDNDAVVVRRRGGSAANVADFAARLSGRSRLVAQQGADGAGARLVAGLCARGVDVVGGLGGRTGTIVVLVDPDGERTFLTDRGCAPDLATFEPGWLDEVDVVHVPAYAFTGGPIVGVVRELVHAAHARGVAVSIDTSSVAVIEALGTRGFLARLAELRPAVLLANQQEARALGLVVDGEVRAPLGVGCAVVKQGAAETLVGGRARGSTVAVAPPIVATVVDTTAAGDAFAAGFLLAWTAGASEAAAAARGNAVAAQLLRAPRDEATELAELLERMGP